MRIHYWAAASLVMLALNVPTSIAAQDQGTISGRVVDADGQPVPDAEVNVVSVGRRIRVTDDATFRIENLPPGDYLIEVTSTRAGRAVEAVAVQPGATSDVTVTLSLAFHAQELVVTAGPQATRRSELYQPTNVLSERELATRSANSLGETLRDEPGVNSTYFGPGSSRPIIRGLGGDRVRVLEGGVGTGDASNTSPDHAVSIEPATAERIEVVRGPATLLYGSSAIGGVVNVIDRRIPRTLPSGPVEGSFRAGAGSVADEIMGGGELNGAFGRVAWHLAAFGRETDDYRIPGFADVDAGEDGHEEEEEPGHEEEPFGLLENSANEALRGAVGVSYVGDNGFVGVSWSAYDSKYGVPGHGHEEDEHGHEEEEEPGHDDEVFGESAFVDLQQRRIDLETDWRLGSRILEGVKGRFGYSDYIHYEMEAPGIVGTTFTNDEWEGRAEIRHRAVGPLAGAVGLQVSNRDFAAIGEEAFVPPNQTDKIGIFLFEEAATGPVRFQLGGRYERQTAANDLSGLELEHSGVSVSGGVNWELSDGLSLAFSGSRSVKLPTPEELFSNGPHLATRAFEIGATGLEEETAVTADLTAHVDRGAFHGEASMFVNSFDDFIYQRFTDAEEDGLPVLVYDQTDARFWGFEVHADIGLLRRAKHLLALELTSDYVRAERTDVDEPLPRIPPLRFGGGLHYESGPVHARFNAIRVTEQDRISANETATDGYTMLDASVGYRLFTGGLTHEITLRGSNLGNAEARNHVSFLKDSVPFPGRDLRVTYQLLF